MKIFVISIIFGLLLSLIQWAWIFAADDPRLESIRQQREAMAIQKRIGQMIYENAALIEEKLDREEAKIKAEKPKEEKKAE